MPDLQRCLGGGFVSTSTRIPGLPVAYFAIILFVLIRYLIRVWAEHNKHLPTARLNAANVQRYGSNQNYPIFLLLSKKRRYGGLLFQTKTGEQVKCNIKGRKRRLQKGKTNSEECVSERLHHINVTKCRRGWSWRATPPTHLSLTLKCHAERELKIPTHKFYTALCRRSV